MKHEHESKWRIQSGLLLLNYTTSLYVLSTYRVSRSFLMPYLHMELRDREPAEQKDALQIALQKAEKVKEGKLGVEQELRRKRSRSSQGSSCSWAERRRNRLNHRNLLFACTETTLNKVQRASLLLTYEINAVGPILVVKHMWPLLKVGGGTGTEREFAIVANISTRVRSIGDNHLRGWHSYRSSMPGLNQLTKTVSVEFARKKDPIICILMHPGTVDTDLPGPFQRNVPEGKLFTKEFSVQMLLNIINNAKKSDNGKFFAWDGQEIPW